MKVHEFTLILTVDPNEEESDRLYSITVREKCALS